ncbi:hypothetical protein EB796_014099 [Bugula neritina]|uniref:Uncharacterized protein n=1 Tax=Bugula neritina TaxID=10212 RepID=A0A7J7JQ60_BUGNE|nr:hypothetical protein EB796_014099 [Bugula neritina]
MKVNEPLHSQVPISNCEQFTCSNDWVKQLSSYLDVNLGRKFSRKNVQHAPKVSERKEGGPSSPMGPGSRLVSLPKFMKKFVFINGVRLDPELKKIEAKKLVFNFTTASSRSYPNMWLRTRS